MADSEEAEKASPIRKLQPLTIRYPPSAIRFQVPFNPARPVVYA
jgi:hypothetical protein